MHKKMNPIKAYRNEDTNKQESCYQGGYTWVSMLRRPSKAAGNLRLLLYGGIDH